MAAVPELDYADAVRGAELLALIRIGLGVAAWVAPDRVTEPWVGVADRAEARAVLSRALGGRDIALGLGALLAARNHRGVRGWVEAGGLADAGDLVATIIGFRRLPRLSRWALLVVTAGAVGAAGVLAPSLSESAKD